MASDEIPSYTVSQITTEIRNRLKTMSRIILSGEISSWRVSSAGHAYFTLKDEGAQIGVVMFAAALESVKRKIGDVLKDGASVDLFGSIDVYANRGNYQFIARSARLKGVGDLMQRYLQLKARLEAEGLFSAARKRPLPTMPRRIALVTSDTGAVIHDLLTVLTRRFPNLEIRLYPSLVQGEAAPKTLIDGIRHFNDCVDWRADLLIVARGGGSFEDLFCFNDESLVRTLAASGIPTISAVGHETDFTLCDFVADRRAGTPSIAAEIAVPVLSDIVANLTKVESRLVNALRGRGEWAAQRLDQLEEALSSNLRLSSERAKYRLHELSLRLDPALGLCFERSRSRLDKAAAKLQLLSPFAVLKRGYSLTMRGDGSIVRKKSDIRAGEEITTDLADGQIVSVVKE